MDVYDMPELLPHPSYVNLQMVSRYERKLCMYLKSCKLLIRVQCRFRRKTMGRFQGVRHCGLPRDLQSLCQAYLPGPHMCHAADPLVFFRAWLSPGYDVYEIDTVAQQSGVSWDVALLAMRQEGNLVDAIISLV